MVVSFCSFLFGPHFDSYSINLINSTNNNCPSLPSYSCILYTLNNLGLYRTVLYQYINTDASNIFNFSYMSINDFYCSETTPICLHSGEFRVKIFYQITFFNQMNLIIFNTVLQKNGFCWRI